MMTVGGGPWHVTSTAMGPIIVLGSGNFGSCLADHLADQGSNVQLWARSSDVVNSINSSHKHPRYLKDHVFDKRLTAIGPNLPDPAQLAQCDALVFAIPTQVLRSLLRQLQLDKLERVPLLIFVNKGIETGTLKLPHEMIKEECGARVAECATFISGPSFAKEIVKRQPTQVSVVSESPEHARKTAELFHQPHFRCYVNTDVVGVEVAGALKNCYAIAAGVATGLGFGQNTRAGLVTRALAELSRIGVALGARPLTFLSLAGVGDLFLTCSSEQSRNFTVGRALAKGDKSLKQILEALGSVAEGVDTAKSAHELVHAKQIHAPILEHVYRLLWEGESAPDLAKALMQLPILDEHEGLDYKPHEGA